MLDKYPEDKLRAEMKNNMGLMRGFDVATEIPLSSVTEEELRGAPHTTRVNRK